MNHRRERQAFLAVEGMLSAAHPRADTQNIVTELESRFLTAYSMFKSDASLLERMGLDAQDALLISKMQELNRYMAGNYMEKAMIGTLTLASAYLTETMRTLSVEQCHLFCLDARGRLIKRIIMEEGTEDAVMFSVKDVITSVIRHAPKAILIAHNHPQRTLRPSQDDLDCTKRIIQALQVLGVPLLDHLIIAGRRVVSIRRNDFFPASVWLAQAPENRLLRDWLADDEE